MEKEQTKKTSKVLTVSTTYARVAVMLLAFNFLLTGYLLTAFMDAHTAQNGDMDYAPPVTQTSTPTTTAETEEPID